MKWSNSCRSALPHFLLLLGSTSPFSFASPAAAVGAHLGPRGPIPQEWVPPQTVTITETARYTLTVLTTLTVDPRISTSVVNSETISTFKSTTTQTSTLTSTTATTITPNPTTFPKIRRQVPQQPSTVTVTTTVWDFPDVTITSTISFTAPVNYFTTMTSISPRMTTDIVTESMAVTRIVTTTVMASTIGAAGQEAVENKKKGPQVEVVVGATFAALIVVIALLVFLYVKLVRGGATGDAGAAGAAGGKKRYPSYAARPMGGNSLSTSAIKSLLHPRKQSYNPVPASDPNLLNPPYNPASSSRAFPPPQPQAQPYQIRHSYIPYSPPLAPTFPPTTFPSTYLPISPTPPRLPQIQVTRANTTSTVSSLSSSSNSDPPVPIHPLTAAGARLPPVREGQFHALTTAGEERRMSTPRQDEPVEPEALWYSPNRGGNSGGNAGGGALS